WSSRSSRPPAAPRFRRRVASASTHIRYPFFGMAPMPVGPVRSLSDAADPERGEHGGSRMKKLVYLVATTIDGYIASESSDNPDFFFTEGPQASDLLVEFPEMIPTHIRP